jgi:hypothetical protein
MVITIIGAITGIIATTIIIGVITATIITTT